jgi:hypothetical protein
MKRTFWMLIGEIARDCINGNGVEQSWYTYYCHDWLNGDTPYLPRNSIGEPPLAHQCAICGAARNEQCATTCPNVAA